jgi:hypothetical protein
VTRIVLVLVLVLVPSLAAADTPAGIYKLDDAGAGGVSIDSQPLPPCNHAQRFAHLAFGYDGRAVAPAPWRLDKVENDQIIAVLTGTPANTEVFVWFGRVGTQARGHLFVIERDASGQPRCGDERELVGRFTP